MDLPGEFLANAVYIFQSYQFKLLCKLTQSASSRCLVNFASIEKSSSNGTHDFRKCSHPKRPGRQEVKLKVRKNRNKRFKTK